MSPLVEVFSPLHAHACAHPTQAHVQRALALWRRETTRCVRNHCWREPTLTHVCCGSDAPSARADGPLCATRAAALTVSLWVLMMAAVPSVASGRLEAARLARVAAHAQACARSLASSRRPCVPGPALTVCVSMSIFLNIMPGGTPGLQHETESTAHTKLSTTTGMRGRRLVEQCARKTSPRCKVEVGWLISRAPDLQAELVCPSAARGRQCNCCPVWQSQPTSGHPRFPAPGLSRQCGARGREGLG